MRKFLKDNTLAIIIVVVTFGGIILFSVLPKPSVALSSGIVAIISAITGVLLTVLVTKSLLDKQSENEKDKDKSAKVFEEKLQIYKEFLSKLNEVVKAEKISDAHVKDLIFQISYITMHTPPSRVNTIVNQIGTVIKEIDSDEGKYKKLADNTRIIVLELQQALYKNEKLEGETKIDATIFDSLAINLNDAISENQQLTEMKELDTEEKIELQTYFWMELTKQLKVINSKYEDVNFNEEKIKDDVIKYYARARNRYRQFGFGFEVYKAKSDRKVGFYVEIENEYYYGFAWTDNPSSDEDLKQIIKQVSPKYNSNTAWAGWRYPDSSTEENRHDLNFWKLTQHSGMKRLINKSTREELIKEIAKEMDEQIKKFIEISEREKL